MIYYRIIDSWNSKVRDQLIPEFPNDRRGDASAERLSGLGISYCDVDDEPRIVSRKNREGRSDKYLI